MPSTFVKEYGGRVVEIKERHLKKEVDIFISLLSDGSKGLFSF